MKIKSSNCNLNLKQNARNFENNLQNNYLQKSENFKRDKNESDSNKKFKKVEEDNSLYCFNTEKNLKVLLDKCSKNNLHLSELKTYQKIEFSKFEVFMHYAFLNVCKSNSLKNKSQLYSYLKKTAIKFFDVEKIVNTNMQLNQLKYLCLNDYQFLATEAAKKPLVTHSNNFILNEFEQLNHAKNNLTNKEKSSLFKDYIQKEYGNSGDKKVEEKDAKLFSILYN